MAPEQFIFYICKTAYIMGTGIIIIYYETDLQFYLCTNQPNNRIIFLFLISSHNPNTAMDLMETKHIMYWKKEIKILYCWLCLQLMEHEFI